MQQYTTRDAQTPEAARAWLARCPASRRGPIANWFHQAVRGGANTPDDVLDAVSRQMLKTLTSPYREPDRRAHLCEALARLTTERDDARRYAQTVLTYEALPPAARASVKAARQAEHLQAWMATQPATEKQLNYLHLLGHRTTEPLSKRDASHLINALVHQREALL